MDDRSAPYAEPGDERLRGPLARQASPIADDGSVPVTSDGYRTSLDVYGPDVVDSGLDSDASVSGMDADLDAMPGDELPISRP